MTRALLYRTTVPKPDDPDVYEPLCVALAKGHSQASAAALAGIHEDTLYHWRYQGEAELAAAQGNWIPWEELGHHARLIIRLKEAWAGLESEALDHIRGGKNDWAAWMTLLERRCPHDWGRQNRLEVTQIDSTRDVLAGIGALTLQEITRRLLASQNDPQGASVDTTPTLPETTETNP